MELVNACRAVLEPEKGRGLDTSDAYFEKSLARGADLVEDVEERFSAEAFVQYLLYEGSKVPCDETSDTFNNNFKLPPFYNDKLFRRGQKFFHKNMFGLFLGKFLGLVLLLTLPSVDILFMTNMSSTDVSAYKRYMATVFHMCLWYDEEFVPGSRSWNSISTVRRLHNSASKRGCLYINRRITQSSMALTQFGFMGLILTRGEMLGLHHVSEEELKGFIHLWRNVGYVMGIEDRFNICRESVKETKEICNLLIEKVFKETLRKPSEYFPKLSTALVNGMWVVNPILDYKVFLLYLKMVVENDRDVRGSPDFERLSSGSKLKLWYIVYTVWALRFTVVRVIHNGIQALTLWMMTNFPFLAYYKFGKGNSLVQVE
ncbi:hypothetical protein NQ315_007015 [Exocentrus adspersus]|uniref:ER-bound oxygenase mpaB/mpaB'/Rubber oxygenase catalytic domain-containing protein n=1 Tax=Exocentrus adspersus TaxID=1586481 RepID=A0AAV8WCI0_9CUCU|nr:hypothetical protein NQ315_007015 [Exocentrus adspersus]